MSTVDQLVEIYQKQEEWHTNKLSPEDSREYFMEVIDKGEIITCLSKEKEVLGYVEFYQIDTHSGKMGVAFNGWIHPDYRRGFVFKELFKEFIKRNSNCLFFAEHALRKQTKPIKVFKNREVI